MTPHSSPPDFLTCVWHQDFEIRWRSAQARILSALRLGEGGLRTLRPIQRHPLPPHDASTTAVESREKPVALKARVAHLPSSSRDSLSVEESREEALALLRQRRHGHGHTEYSDPILEVARSSARTGGRGRLIALGDPHRSWGRGWGSAMSGSRRAVGVRGTLDWVGRVARDEDDLRREGSRRRLVRSDLSHRMAARGRRAASVESRLDPRRPAARVFHEYDRSEGFAEYRDDESGALLVEFNDGADGEPEVREGEAPGVEGGSAGSADSADISQDGDDMVRSTTSCEVYFGHPVLQLRGSLPQFRSSSCMNFPERSGLYCISNSHKLVVVVSEEAGVHVSSLI